MITYRIKMIAFNRARPDIIKIRALSCGLSFSTLYSLLIISILGGWLFEKFGVF